MSDKQLGAEQILAALPVPILHIAQDETIAYANSAAEEFFARGRKKLLGGALAELLPHSALAASVQHALAAQESRHEYGLDVSRPHDTARRVDVQVTPLMGGALLMIEPLARAQKMASPARGVAALAAMLAHEIKNPLSAVRGAAQLLEPELSEESVTLAQLICTETDRIAALANQFDMLSAPRQQNEPINMHSVLDHVVRLAKAGFGRGCRFVQDYDPSLPDICGDRDRLIQVFLNLIKNAAEARRGGEIRVSSAFRSGLRLQSGARLPLEFCVIDYGGGVAEDMRAHIFDPFVTSKPRGSGLGLTLVAKIIGEHGGIVEYDRDGARSIFRVLLPTAQGKAA